MSRLAIDITGHAVCLRASLAFHIMYRAALASKIVVGCTRHFLLLYYREDLPLAFAIVMHAVVCRRCNVLEQLLQKASSSARPSSIVV